MMEEDILLGEKGKKDPRIRMDTDEENPLLGTPPSRVTFLKPPTKGKRSGYEAVEGDNSLENSYLKKSQEGKSQRNPFLINSQVIDGSHDDEHINTLAQYNRYRYYTKLHRYMEKIVIPDHVVPSYLFLPIPSFVKAAIEQGKQSSLITIFAIWNTMMGTSLLSMPWAITQSGLGLGIGLMLLIAAICLFTCLLILKSANHMDDSLKHDAFEFSDVCYRYLGKFGKYTCVVFSIVALLGAAVVYWVLLSNFLFSAGKFTFDKIHRIPHHVNVTHSVTNTSVKSGTVICANGPEMHSIAQHVLTPSDNGIFFHLWKKQMTVPFYLILVLFPLSCLKSPTFFTKFNALGTLAVFYMLIFIVIKASSWGINVYGRVSPHKRVSLVEWSSLQFPSLSGTLGLALYIHNCILSITRNQANPKNNTRDVCVAYVLATGTYLVMGVLCYICFPLAKSCIQEVLLDNFPTSDVLTFTAQMFLLFQMVTVYPLLLYIIRVQVLSTLFGKVFPGWPHVILLNGLVIGTGILFAVFYPHVGHIIRYVGSISALVYIFGLPCIVHMVILYKEDHLTWPSAIFYSFIVFLGVVNLVLQFFVS